MFCRTLEDNLFKTPLSKCGRSSVLMEQLAQDFLTGSAWKSSPGYGQHSRLERTDQAKRYAEAQYGHLWI